MLFQRYRRSRRRHPFRRTIGIVFIVFVIGFFLRLTHEAERARLSEKRALEQEQLAAQRLNELRGTAAIFPHFAPIPT